MSSQESPFQTDHSGSNLYIVTDSHLDLDQASCNEFVEMLDALHQVKTLIFLGDLFKVWLAQPKYWLDSHRQVMDAFGRHRDQDREVVFIAGNREKLLPKEWENRKFEPFPFTHLSQSSWSMDWAGKKLGFIHGDTINSRDFQYLLWRSISNSSFLEAVFNAMPVRAARWFANRLERMLDQTNLEIKIDFPEDEVQRFAKQRLQNKDLYFVGHFHLDFEMRVNGVSGCLRFVPDWLGTRKVLRVDSSGQVATLHYSKGQFTEVA